jgi:hypothetical protein
MTYYADQRYIWQWKVSTGELKNIWQLFDMKYSIVKRYLKIKIWSLNVYLRNTAGRVGSLRGTNCGKRSKTLVSEHSKQEMAGNVLYKKQAFPNMWESSPVSQGWYQFYRWGESKHLKKDHSMKMDILFGSSVVGGIPRDTHRCYSWCLFLLLSWENQKGWAGHSWEALAKEKFRWKDCESSWGWCFQAQS